MALDRDGVLRQALHYAKIPASGVLVTVPRTLTSRSRSEALDDLRRAVHALSDHYTAPRHRADLDLIDEAVARLAAEPMPAQVAIAEFDASRLAHLMDLTGPDLAQELLARLTEDLGKVLDVVGSDAAASDWKRLREATHVLISLSGSVGALSLQAMAESLNAVAHRQDQPAAAAILPPLSQELRALIAYVGATVMQSSPQR